MIHLREYLKLIRPYGILFLGFTPVFSAIANGGYNSVHLGILLLIGLMLHIFTFVQNDYYDIAIDQQSPHVTGRPLTTGVIKPRQAFLLFSAAFFLSLILACLFLFSWISLACLLLAFLLMTLYNKYSKRIPGMECVLGLGVFVFGLFGAYSVAPILLPLSVIVSAVGFFQWMFSVGISANLKDVATDTALGVRTTPTILGVTTSKNIFNKPYHFLAYAYGLKLMHLFIAALPFLLGFTSPFILSYPIPVLGFLIICGILLITTIGILTTPLAHRDTMLRYEGLHEGLALLLLPFVLMTIFFDHFGLFPTLGLFLLLIVWPLAILRFLYGKRLIPLE